ncbi:MAG: sensor histidine kinase, partial [Solirubrobacteraceae bacterium]
MREERREAAGARGSPRAGGRAAGSALTVSLGAAVGAAVVLVVYGPSPGLQTLALLLVLGGAALACAHLAAARRRRLGPLRRQFSLAVAIAAGQTVVLAGAVAALMLVSAHDALVVAVMAVFAGLVAARAAQLLAAGVMGDVETLRDGLRAVGEGEREVRLETSGRDELSELADAANAMAARLRAEEAAREAADGARRDLVAAVSHDLRTPITSLRLLAEAVDDDIVDEATRRRYLAQMRTHIHALSQLIDDLFELSRLEAGDIQWSMERVRLDTLVGETVDAMRAEAMARRVAVLAEVGASLEPVRGNPEKLQRVLFNLIQNAMRHTPADGSVTVRARRNSEGLEVEVADTGEGIPPSERERVFDPFYRGGSEGARTRSG